MYDRLLHYLPRQGHAPGSTASAVLVPILSGADGDRLLFTKRTQTLNSHKGQVCFPGGKRSPEDPDLVATALREAEEEVGIRPEDVEILGVLDDVVTITGFTITPVVGRLAMPYPFKANPDEIDRLIELPLAELLVPRAISLEERITPGGQVLNIYSFWAEGDLVWGATARITKRLVDLLTDTDAPMAPELPDQGTLGR
ncbi:MAG TPA: CoA pyrophosphatase [Stenomitos sp.]